MSLQAKFSGVKGLGGCTATRRIYRPHNKFTELAIYKEFITTILHYKMGYIAVSTMSVTDQNPFVLAGLTEPDGENSRCFTRHKVLKGATIVFNDRNSALTCLVRDISGGGAHLELPNTDGVPDSFVLQLSADGSETECRVIWRQAKELGIVFTSTSG